MIETPHMQACLFKFQQGRFLVFLVKKMSEFDAVVGIADIEPWTFEMMSGCGHCKMCTATFEHPAAFWKMRTKLHKHLFR